ncbi:MAG: hypothetical protein ABT05_03425 [Lautropia sp. SCN 66-9]|nr:MAG: hypothetical protein ABT05_03425 [Lautropia sp. SCN 66-9]
MSSRARRYSFSALRTSLTWRYSSASMKRACALSSCCCSRFFRWISAAFRSLVCTADSALASSACGVSVPEQAAKAVATSEAASVRDKIEGMRFLLMGSLLAAGLGLAASAQAKAVEQVIQRGPADAQ